MKRKAKPGAQKAVRERALRPSAAFRSLPSPLNGPRTRGVYSALGYHAVTTAIRDGRAPVSGSGDIHLRFNREQLVNQAREFARDNGIFQGMIEKAVGYIVGSGFGLQARTAEPGWNKRAEEWFRASSEMPDYCGLLSWEAMQNMVCREVLTCGDTGAIFIQDGTIQLIESEQIAGPTHTNDGLRRQGSRITGYYVAPYGPHGNVEVTRATLFENAEFMFVAQPDRPSSKRGVPPCQASFAMLHRINDVCDNEAIARQLLSRFAVAITKAGGAQTGHTISTDDPAKASDPDGQLTSRMAETDTAIAFFGEQGDKIEGIERNIPGSDFPSVITMYMRLMGLPLGLPLEIILLDWTKSNYSQSRAVLEQAYQSFLKWQLLLERRFYRRVYQWHIDRGIAARVLSDRVDKYAHEWIRPTFPWIDQLAEANAKGAMLDRSFTTLGSVLRSLNKDKDEVLTARVAEITDGIRKSQEIKKSTGVEVPWQHLAGLPYSVNGPAKEEPAEAKPKEPEEKPEPKDEEAKATPPVAPEKSKRVVWDVVARDDAGRIKTAVLRTVEEGA